MALITDAHLDSPDDFYEALIDAHDGLDRAGQPRAQRAPGAAAGQPHRVAGGAARGAGGGAGRCREAGAGLTRLHAVGRRGGADAELAGRRILPAATHRATLTGHARKRPPRADPASKKFVSRLLDCAALRLTSSAGAACRALPHVRPQSCPQIRWTETGRPGAAQLDRRCAANWTVPPPFSRLLAPRRGVPYELSRNPP